MTLNFMAAVTVCSDAGAQEDKKVPHCRHSWLLSHLGSPQKRVLWSNYFFWIWIKLGLNKCIPCSIFEAPGFEVCILPLYCESGWMECVFPKLLCLAASLRSIVEHTLGSSVFNTNMDSSRREKELVYLPIEEEAKLALKAILWIFKKNSKFS